MSYLSYFDNELRLNPQYNGIKNQVKKLLEIVSDQGHSGGSMSIFGPLYKQYADNPHPIEEPNSLLYPIWNEIKDLSKQDRKAVLKIASRISTFTPLSPLTGEDDEWNLIYEDKDEKTYQNRRSSNIFKHNDKAYNIDGKIFYTPNNTYTDFIGFTNSESRVKVEFPFDPETKPISVFYRDDVDRVEINGDPNEWLEKSHQLFMSGYHPITESIVKEANLLNSKDELESFKSFFYSYLTALEKIDKREVEYLNSDLTYCHPLSRFFEFRDDDRNLVVSTNNYSHVRNTFRLLSDPKLKDILNRHHHGDLDKTLTEYINEHFSLGIHYVSIPDKNYQKWITSEYVRPILIPKTDVSIDYYYDERNNVLIVDNSQKYLYHRCKELGLEYKGKRN